MEREKLHRRPQFISLVLSSLLAVSALGVAISDNTTAQPIPDVTIRAENARLNVVPSTRKAPRPTASTLQGAQPVQQSSRPVDQAGSDASSVLQPNSGRSNFTQQDKKL